MALRISSCLLLATVATLAASTPATASGCAKRFIFERDAKLGVGDIAPLGQARHSRPWRRPLAYCLRVLGEGASAQAGAQRAGVRDESQSG